MTYNTDKSLQETKVEFRCSKEQREAARKKAAEMGMSLSAYMRYLIVKAIEGEK